MMSSNHSQNRFATTRWSVVMACAANDSPGAEGALTELAQRYWYPVYAYVRRCGHSPAIAQDITRSFLQHLLENVQGGRVQAAHGHFRRYLLSELNAFLVGDWRDGLADTSDAQLLPPPAELESRYQRDIPAASSPEETYQRYFALEVLARAIKRLRSEARKTGHLGMYEALEAFLGVDPGPGIYEDLARRLNSRPLALVVALKRLRQRFRELVGEELADTVTSAEDLIAEQQALHSVLHHVQA